MKQIIVLLIAIILANLLFEAMTMEASYRSEETLAATAVNDIK